MARITLRSLPPCNPAATLEHHVGSPPTSFVNHWPSCKANNGSLLDVLSARFGIGRQKNFVPVPENREGLVKVRKPEWGQNQDPEHTKLKATWIGHASWLLETSARRQAVGEVQSMETSTRGVRILLDPVFSERTSPVQWFGPKRYTPTPCTVADLPIVDLCLISHSHYDHLDLATIQQLYAKNVNTHFLCGLGNAKWFHSCGIKEENVTELDWWQGVDVDIENVGHVKLTCTPAQHFSGRTGVDKNKTLWCSWVIEEASAGENVNTNRRVYFAGDTGYRYVPKPHPTPEEEDAQPHCPAFKEIGEILGPFDLAMLPIGLCHPRDFMSSIHCAPEDAICVHRDIRSKKSIGMHYGTVRGGISAYYEDVHEPPRRWQELCEKNDLKWGEETGLCDIGETILV